jgi:hypothetical protein
MVRGGRSFIAVLAALTVAACSSRETAIVLEVSQGAVAPLEEVRFAIQRVDVAEPVREALVPLSGENAKRFPVRLVLVNDAPGGAAFEVAIEGRQAGVVVANGIPAGGSSHVEFVNGQVVTQRFVLEPLGGPANPDAGPATASETPAGSPADAGVQPFDAAPQGPAPGPPATPPPPAGPGQACGGEAARCAGDLVCVAGRCCVTSCQDVCLAGTCSTSGTCVALQNGTPCHGNSKMTCQDGRCVKAE